MGGGVKFSSTSRNPIQTPWHLVNVRGAWPEAEDLAFLARSARIGVFEIGDLQFVIFHFHFL